MRGIVLFTVLAAQWVPGGAAAQSAVARWSAWEEVRIGSEDEPGNVLTRVSQVRLGPGGAMLVGQPMDHTIRVYDGAGRAVRSIGRRGSGPGEFEGLGGFGFLGDTLYASDHRLGRVSLFSADGGFHTTFILRSPLIDDHSPPWYLPGSPSSFLSDGTAMVNATMPVMLMEAGIITQVPWLRLARSGQLLDTLAWQDISWKPVRIVSGGQEFVSRSPFEDPPLVQAMADGSGLAVVERRAATSRGPARFRVTRIGIDGDTLWAREYPYTPVRTPGAVVDAGVEQIVERLSRGRGVRTPPRPAEIERALRSGGHVPEGLPPVTATASGDDGTLWLRREETAAETVRWEVLDRNGVLQATLSLPARVTVHAFAGDVLVGVELDELDVPYVVRYRVTRGG